VIDKFIVFFIFLIYLFIFYENKKKI